MPPRRWAVPSTICATRRIRRRPRSASIGTADVWQSLRQGFSDFEAYRSDVLFLCATYAVIGLVLARIAFGSDLLPLLFPLASGFAIIGPLAAVGLYEMSRRREQGAEVGWANAFDVLKAPAIGGIAAMGAILIAVFLVWLAAAWVIFQSTLAPTLPRAPSPAVFAQAVLFTAARAGDDRAGHGRGLPLRAAGHDDERGVLPAAAGPRHAAWIPPSARPCGRCWPIRCRWRCGV